MFRLLNNLSAHTTRTSAHSRPQLHLPHRRSRPRPRDPTTTTTAPPHPDSTIAEENRPESTLNGPAGFGAVIRRVLFPWDSLGIGSGLWAGRRGGGKTGSSEAGDGDRSKRAAAKKPGDVVYLRTLDEGDWSPRVFQGQVQSDSVRVSAETVECLFLGAKQNLAACAEDDEVSIRFLACDYADGRWREVTGRLERDRKGQYFMRKRTWTGSQDCTLVQGVMGRKGRHRVVLSRRGGWVVVAPRFASAAQKGEPQGQGGQVQQQGQGVEGQQQAQRMEVRRWRLREVLQNGLRAEVQGQQNGSRLSLPGVQKQGGEGLGQEQGPEQLPGPTGGAPCRPLVFELPPGTPVPQLPHPVSQISLTARRKTVVLELPAATVAALFPEEARRGTKGATVEVGHMSAGDTQLAVTNLQLQQLAGTDTSGSGGAEADAWLASGRASSGLCEVLTAREYGTAVLFLDPGAVALRQADGAGPLVRASCLPPPPTAQLERSGGKYGGRQRAVKESVGSSDPAEAARGAAGLARRAAYAAEEQMLKALRKAARAEAWAVRGVKTMAKVPAQYPTAAELAEATEAARAMTKGTAAGGKGDRAGRAAAGSGGVPGVAREAGAKASGQEEEEAQVDPGTEARLAAGTARNVAEAALDACAAIRERARCVKAASVAVRDALESFEKGAGQAGGLDAEGAMTVRTAMAQADVVLVYVRRARRAATKAEGAAEEALERAEAAEGAAMRYDTMRRRDV